MKNNMLSEHYMIAAVALTVLLAVSLILAVTFGTVDMPVGKVYGTITGGITSLFRAEKISAEESPDFAVVWLIRLPRLILAVIVGAGLSVCGAVMQAVVKNPLADPYILGVSSGASLGATLAIISGMGSAFGGSAAGVLGFIGALVSSFLVMTIANMGGRSNAIKLILSGTAVSAMCSAFANFLIFVSNKDSAVKAVMQWTMGSLGGAEWISNGIIATVMISGILFFTSQYRTLNLMLLGDESAVTLGTNLHRYRTVYLAVSALMIGFAVFKSGMIGFVGLIIPHIVRMLFGTDHKKVIVLSALMGAIFLLWADVLSRTLINGTEMPVGIITSVIGAPVFVYLMVKRSYGFGGER